MCGAGPAGSGKSAVAATLAEQSEFPFVKLISPVQMLGLSETEKCRRLQRVQHPSMSLCRFFLTILLCGWNWTD
jgi:hypothetical protein